ncbi:MAG: cobalt-precorrin-6A reductase [Pseudomonadota bacterium]
MRRILLLGGTREARRLGAFLAGVPGISAVMSLAGRTQDPADQGLPLRIGGFGGVGGLAEYLRENRIDLLLDATHPFAEQMSRHAAEASKLTGTRLIYLRRPPWTEQPGEEWIRVPNLEAAVRALPEGARAFAATGRGSLEAFLARRDVYMILRVIDPPGAPFPGNGQFEVARPPFSVAAERRRLEVLGATHLVVKNAGGDPARTKLTAAAALGLPIVIVARNPLPAGVPVLTSVEETLGHLRSGSELA